MLGCRSRLGQVIGGFVKILFQAGAELVADRVLRAEKERYPHRGGFPDQVDVLTVQEAVVLRDDRLDRA